MQVNWFTVIAQIINFLILVWLLKRFLYAPILNAIDERERKIKAQLEDAESQKAVAIKEKEEYLQKSEALDQQKDEIINKTVAESEEQRKKLLEAARNEANTLRLKLEQAWKEAQKNKNIAVAQKIQQEVFAISRKVLGDLASLSLEEQTVQLFIQRLNELNESDKQHFLAAFESSGEMMIQSAFNLSLKLQTEIQTAIQQTLGTTVVLKFKTVPELISGIELVANGYKLAWSVSAYLDSLEKNITVMLNEKPAESSNKLHGIKSIK